MDKFRIDLSNLLKARFPYIYIPTPEETRVIDQVRDICKQPSLVRTPRKLFVWSSVRGMMQDGDIDGPADTKQPLKALEFIEACKDSAVFVLLDFHIYFGSANRPPDYQIVRKLRDLLHSIKYNPASQNVLFVAPVVELPVELQNEITILDFKLPDATDIKALLDDMITANAKNGRIKIEINEDQKQQLVNAALGLTLMEAENAFARGMVNDGRLCVEDVEVILEEKCQVIKKTGILEYVKTDLRMSDVGGLLNLKRWLAKRNGSWLDRASAYSLPAPKGILITGVPGCGKSLTAKAVSATWQLPLLKMDIGRIFSGIVGSSEENMRRALRTAEAVAPSVLWIDEIEKGFASRSSEGDSGTSSRVFGTFLTWMQEKTKPVFVIATANDISKLPPELLRKGRFDEIFFVDLPTPSERLAILKLHLSKRLKNPAITATLKLGPPELARLVEITEGFSGAELEQIIVAALFDAFAENRGLTFDDFTRAASNTVTLAVTQAEEILAIRRWADMRAIAATAREERPTPPPNTPAATIPQRGGRTIDC